MTTVVINKGAPIEVSTEPDESVFDVLLAVQDCWDPDHLIHALTVNGVEVTPLEEATMMAIDAYGADIQLTVAPPEARSVETTVNEVLEYLDRLISGFGKVAADIRRGGKPGAFTMMKDGLSGLATVLELAEMIANHVQAGPDIQNAYQRYLTSLQDKSEELADAQNGGDPTLIADILEYEFVDSVQEIKDLIERMKELLP